MKVNVSGWRIAFPDLSLKTVADYYLALEDKNIRILDSCRALELSLSETQPQNSFELVSLSVEDLGFTTSPKTRAEIYSSAKDLGYHLCPNRVALQILLQDDCDLEIDSKYHVAVEPIKHPVGSLCNLAIGYSQESGLYLGCDHDNSLNKKLDSKWIFMI